MAPRKRPDKQAAAASPSPEPPAAMATSPVRREKKKKAEPAKRDELRLNMMRPIVTELLLSKVQEKKTYVVASALAQT